MSRRASEHAHLDAVAVPTVVAEEPLPGYEYAVIPPEKLYAYALNLEHEEGQHKARVFASALGIKREHWMYLEEQIVEGLPVSGARLKDETVRYQKWEVPILVAGRNERTAFVTTGWIIHAEDRRPKLTSTYVEDSARNRRLLAGRTA